MRKVQTRYGFTRLPFTREVSVEDLFEHTGAEQALARLVAAIEGKASAVVIGESGVGKTFLLRALERKLNPSRYRVTYIHNCGINRRDFFRQLSMALGVESKANAAAVFRQISLHIEELASEQKVHPVLVLDDAHLLPVQVLEHLHTLLNYQRDSRSFLSLLLIGLPELRETLARNLLASLASRLPVRIHHEPIGKAQLAAYLGHRLTIAGCAKDEVFSEEAVLCIREATGGVLRKVDVLAAACLEVACEGGNGTIVDGATVQQAVQLCAEALR